MMDKILGFLQNLKLSLAEWVSVTLALVVGGLVVVLKVQGSELHAVKVKLLRQRLDARELQPSKDTEAAKAAYVRAMQEYKDAGGTV
jgi:hypothetical protein